MSSNSEKCITFEDEQFEITIGLELALKQLLLELLVTTHKSAKDPENWVKAYVKINSKKIGDFRIWFGSEEDEYSINDYDFMEEIPRNIRRNE